MSLRNILLTGIGHFLLGGISFYILYKFGVINNLPNEINLMNWDAEWFNSIRLNGYKFIKDEICNLAFFPFFSYFWKWTSLSGLGISLLNCTVFIFSLSYLLKNYSLQFSFLLFLFPTVSFIFFALPYSESFFFLFATLILTGYTANSTWMLVVGFFFASVTRSVTLIFIPALILSTFFIYGPKISKQNLRVMMYSIVACLSGLLCSAIIQYQQTHKWLYFLTVQKIWGREWILPGFPLTSVDPEHTLGIDASAFIVGLFAIYFCCKYAIQVLRRIDKSKIMVINQATLFSIICLSAITILDTCFTYKEHSSSNIWSLNRHLFCSPFYVIFIAWLYQIYNFTKTEQLMFVLIILVGVFFTGVYQYPALTAFYLILFFSFYLLKYSVNNTKYLVFFYLFNTFLQVLAYQDFLSNIWVG